MRISWMWLDKRKFNYLMLALLATTVAIWVWRGGLFF
jgi:hypothetical protein